MGSRLKPKPPRRRPGPWQEWRLHKLLVYLALAVGLTAWMVYVWLDQAG